MRWSHSNISKNVRNKEHCSEANRYICEETMGDFWNRFHLLWISLCKKPWHNCMYCWLHHCTRWNNHSNTKQKLANHPKHLLITRNSDWVWCPLVRVGHPLKVKPSPSTKQCSTGSKYNGSSICFRLSVFWWWWVHEDHDHGNHDEKNWCVWRTEHPLVNRHIQKWNHSDK